MAEGAMDEKRAAIMARLRRIEGQARGVQNMITEGRSCEDVVIQLASMRAAVTKAALNIVSCYLEECLREDGDLEGALQKVQRLFSNLA